MAHALRPTVIYNAYPMRGGRQKLPGKKNEKGTKRQKAENGDGKKEKSLRQGQKVRERERKQKEKIIYDFQNCSLRFYICVSYSRAT
jgi:hypothetical protein